MQLLQQQHIGLNQELARQSLPALMRSRIGAALRGS